MMSRSTGKSLSPPLRRRPGRTGPPSLILKTKKSSAPKRACRLERQPWSLKTESCGNRSRLIDPSPCRGMQGFKANGPMTQKEIAASTGFTETSAVPRVRRTGVPEEGYMRFYGYTGFFVSATATGDI